MRSTRSYWEHGRGEDWLLVGAVAAVLAGVALFGVMVWGIVSSVFR